MTNQFDYFDRNSVYKSSRLRCSVDISFSHCSRIRNSVYYSSLIYLRSVLDSLNSTKFKIQNRNSNFTWNGSVSVREIPYPHVCSKAFLLLYIKFEFCTLKSWILLENYQKTRQINGGYKLHRKYRIRYKKLQLFENWKRISSTDALVIKR